MPRVYDKSVLEGIEEGSGQREFLDGQLRSILDPEGEEGEEEMEEPVQSAVQSGEEKEDEDAEGEGEGQEKKKIEPIRGF